MEAFVKAIKVKDAPYQDQNAKKICKLVSVSEKYASRYETWCFIFDEKDQFLAVSRNLSDFLFHEQSLQINRILCLGNSVNGVRQRIEFMVQGNTITGDIKHNTKPYVFSEWELDHIFRIQ